MSRFRPERIAPPAGSRTRMGIETQAVVVGGGIAGVAAATILAERGVRVDLVEREPVLGGRVSGWTDTLRSGESFQMERGFHGFFRQYYNLRNLLRRVDANLGFLRPLGDYPLLGPDGAAESFSDLPRRAPFNVVSLVRRSASMSWREALGVNKRAALEMLAFDPRRTYALYDDRSAREFLDSLAFPPRARQMLFDVFSHSFFNPEEEMSAGELLMMFHFYFMGNPEGLVFDVLDDAFSTALWGPFHRYLKGLGVRIHLGTSVTKLEQAPLGWRVHCEGGRDRPLRGDAIVLAVTVPALRQIVDASPDLDDPTWRAAVRRLDVTWPFAVWRLWLDKPVRPERHPFAGTAGMGILDNISCYHLFEEESRRWAATTGGSVIELHAYAVPPQMDETAIREELLAQLHLLYPETLGARTIEGRFLMRRDCPAFPPGSWAQRPGVTTPIDEVTLAGDFVRLPFPTALMERAAASGIMAANHLLARWDVRGEPLWSVPRQGLLAGLLPNRGA